ncbi:hypothetical protein QWM81_09915 [Streptomyces ficellus]|uniref:Uncharacterized protein n=1 Tax=Streptomyces ficellus TaxID=1977088 RepID=A0ABT7Z4E4_9ACTN|nr:hypothetical protein [Streptomyces ficellus]MDN3294360.1 hypothetical protein [Streptomyces ficellus]
MLKRKLVFYRWTSVAGRASFAPSAVAERLAREIAADSAYQMIDKDGVITAVEVVDAGDEREPTKFRVLALRGHEDRPFKWDPHASIGPISLLENEYPADATHVSIWPDGYCAHDMGRYSPRVSRLAFFLRQKMQEYVNFDPLFNEDAFRKLDEMKGQFRSFDLAMTKPEYSTRDRGTFGKLWPAVAGEELPSVRVSLGMGRYGPKDRYIDQHLEDELLELAARASDLLTGMVVRGRSSRTNRVEEVNLLTERLSVEVELPQRADIPSAPRVESVFHELEQAYKDFKRRGVFETTSTAELMRKD